jgi:hypothetical protein
MREVLSEINKTTGVTGSLLVGNDGIVIASDLNTRMDEETMGALAGSISSTVSKSLERLDASPLSQLTIEADNGKLFITQTPVGFLVVTAEDKVNMGLIRLEIKNAVAQIGI